MRLLPQITLALFLYSLAPASSWAQLKSPQTMHANGNHVSRWVHELTISPTTLDFGSVAVGQTASLQATLTAPDRGVEISSDDLNNSEFSIAGLTFPIKLPAGTSIQVTIQFTPNSSGTVNAQAQFISNAEDSPTDEQLTGTGVASGSHYVDLTWNSEGGDVAGYNIFRGTVSGGPYEQINGSLDTSTSYTDNTVVGGASYYYVATAVNTEGQQSGYSNQIEVTIP
ncbi:MAG: choice-of-anchor D domain-containing protein [Terriglobales bacterium]